MSKISIKIILMAIYILFLPCYLHANRGSDYSAYSLNYSTEQTKEERKARRQERKAERQAKKESKKAGIKRTARSKK